MNRLSHQTYPDAFPQAGTGIVHLGLGAFHRAHQAVFTQEAMLAEPGDWGICAVGQRDPAVRDALAAQDCLFTVTERDTVRDELRVVSSIRKVLLAATESDRVTAALSNPDTKIITITVTEAGYRHDPVSGWLRADDPEVAADLAGGPPRTVIGQLVRGLRERSTPVTVLSCDNLPDNGPLIAGLLRDFCTLSGQPELGSWLAGNVRCPSSVVDQIVPATTEADITSASSRLGLTDRGAVVAETHRSWVIEDSFAAGRPAWDKAGVRLVTDIAPYQAAKLRLVNGTHSALAYLGLLAGLSSTAEAATLFSSYAERLIRTETGATLTGYDTPVDADALLLRLANPRITHQLSQIATDGLRKLPPRLLDPAAELLESGTEPRMICLALAAFLRYTRTPTDSLLATRPVLRDSRTFREMLTNATAHLDRHGPTKLLGSTSNTA
jgi:fructuronate reductase